MHEGKLNFFRSQSSLMRIAGSIKITFKHTQITLIRQRDKLEAVLRHFLVEDRGTDGSASYVDFLCHMHKEIRQLL